MNAPDRFALRCVTTEDETFLRDLYHDVRGDEFASLPPASRQQLLDLQFEAQRRHYHAHYPDAEHLLIVIAGDRAGRLWLQRSAETLHVIDVSLLSIHRCRGIGTALLESLQREAAARHIPVRLSVRRDNPAARLYARLGFAERSADAVYRQLEWAAPGSEQAMG